MARLLPRLLPVVAALIGVALVAYSCSASNAGLDATSGNLPPSVIRLEPPSGSEVLRQATVGIQLREGYDAYLEINGVTVRDVAVNEGDDGLRKVQVGGLLITYTPGPGRKVTQLATPRNTVTAFIYRAEDGSTTAQPLSWSFDAA